MSNLVELVEVVNCCPSDLFAHECFPCLLEGLYEHVKWFVLHRLQTGCFLSHFTLFPEQASQADLSLTGAVEIGVDFRTRLLDIICRL